MDRPNWLRWDEESLSKAEEFQRKYSYVYGIKDLQIQFREFEDASVYVSRPFVIDGNVAEVSLETQDSRPRFSNLSGNLNPYDTCLEYYVAFDENPVPENWIPILPRDTEVIENELLLFRDTPNCKLRFPRDKSKEGIVYKNGIRLDTQYWSYGKENSINIDRRFDKYASYTIRYYPDFKDHSPWDVEILASDNNRRQSFINEDGTEGEVFRYGTDRNGRIVLSKHPYIDYSKVNSGESYNPVQVSIEEAAIAIPGNQVMEYIDTATSPVKTNNITDYKNRSDTTLRPYNMQKDAEGNMIRPELQYLQNQRNLYFTETFNNSHIPSNMETNHGDGIIRVKYDYLRTTTRLKIILRNTANKHSTTTPSLHQYNLLFKVVR